MRESKLDKLLEAEGKDMTIVIVYSGQCFEARVTTKEGIVKTGYGSDIDSAIRDLRSSYGDHE